MGEVEARLSMVGQWIGGQEAEIEIMDYVSYQPGCGRRVDYMVIERRDGSKENFFQKKRHEHVYRKCGIQQESIDWQSQKRSGF